MMNIFEQNTNTVGHQTRDTVEVVRPRQPVLVRKLFRYRHHIAGSISSVHNIANNNFIITHWDFVDSSVQPPTTCDKHPDGFVVVIAA